MKILITGSTDGIGLRTAELLALQGHFVILHGRNADRLLGAQERISRLAGDGKVDMAIADLSAMSQVRDLAIDVVTRHPTLDVLINNAGVYGDVSSSHGMDVRFVVNTLAPYLLTRQLWKAMSPSGRVINLSSAAQALVDLEALRGNKTLSDGQAYAQSKRALTLWTRELAARTTGPEIFSVNPGSMLASKMVQRAFGVQGKSLDIGAEILVRCAVSPGFSGNSGRYFDNDIGEFSDQGFGETQEEVDELMDCLARITGLS